MTGNCLKGSRPLLYFDAGFDTTPQMKVAKELLQQIFNVPRGHHKSKPFIDHVLGFYLVDGRIWLRNFQISHMRESSNPEPVLAEIGARKNSFAQGCCLVALAERRGCGVMAGPRVVLNPIRLFGGSFGGPTLWDNPNFVSPNDVRAMERRQKGGEYSGRVVKEHKKRVRREETAPPPDPLADVFS